MQMFAKKGFMHSGNPLDTNFHIQNSLNEKLDLVKNRGVSSGSQATGVSRAALQKHS